MEIIAFVIAHHTRVLLHISARSVQVLLYLMCSLTSHTIFFLNKFIYLFIYFWLCWVFVSVRGLSLVVAGRGHSSSRCAGLPPSQPLLLRSTGSRRAGSVVVAHEPSCSAACGIFPDQDSNPYPLHWQADSQPLHHQGSPHTIFLHIFVYLYHSVHPRLTLMNT